jgi:hypothetical protein
MEMSREKLTEIIEANDGCAWWVPEAFEKKIRPQLPPELKILEAPPIAEENYNCFVFALGLENDPDFLGGKNPVQQEFIRHLLEQKILVKISDPIPSTLVFYEDSDKAITHGGILSGNEEIMSKWMWGPTISHKLWDVPSSFGDKVFYCTRISPEKAKAAYIKYKNSGVEIKPII